MRKPNQSDIFSWVLLLVVCVALIAMTVDGLVCHFRPETEFCGNEGRTR